MIKLILLTASLLLFSGCKSIDSSQADYNTDTSTNSSMNNATSDFDSNSSDNNKIISDWGVITNEERLTQFIDNFEQNTADKIIIESYTIEGDPIFQTLVYDGTQIELIEDYSYDSYQNQPELTSKYYNRIIFRNGQYILQDTDNEAEFLLIQLAEETTDTLE
ncbi:DUF4362 domain-containing protein [Enterococcus sp. LJL90]